MKAPALGIDIGGSAVKLGLVSTGGRVVARRQFTFEAGLDFAGFVERLALSVEDVLREAQTGPVAVGLALPGYVEPDAGVSIDGTHNVPILMGHSLPHALSDRLRLGVVAQNDGVAATIGELRFGAGRGLQRFLMLTIGTGIGGGLVVGGRLITGSRGEPPELGAMVLDPAGPKNYSGLSGTFEALASVSGLNLAYGSEGLPASAIFERAAVGDSAASAAIDGMCRSIAQACGILINALNLQACILGGGVSNAGEPLLERVRAHLPDFTWPMLLAKCELRLASLRNEAGIIGAAVLSAEQMEENIAPSPAAPQGIAYPAASRSKR